MQGQFDQAVSSSYETVLLGARSGQAHLIAQSTVNVGKVGQRYVEMLAEVVAQLVKAGHGRPAAQVKLVQLLALWRTCTPSPPTPPPPSDAPPSRNRTALC